MKRLTKSEVKELIDRIGASGGYNFTQHSLVFPEGRKDVSKGRKDVCVVREKVVDGDIHLYDIVFLVWRGMDGCVKYKELINSRHTKYHIDITRFEVDEDGSLSVDLVAGRIWSFDGWAKTLKIVISNDQVSAKTVRTVRFDD
jgi:hypothetical protein